MESQAGPGFFLPFAVDIHAMRTFLRAHWKVIVAIILLVLLALFTVNPGAAVPELPLAARLRAHVTAIASAESSRYIENVLAMDGYAVRRHPGRNIEVSVSNLAPNARPARIFIVGANARDNGSGTAAVLELARLLKNLRPSLGTEVKFVFFMDPPQTGSFIAFAGTMASARQVQDALSAFRAVADTSARGLAAPAYVQGVTLSSHTAYRGSGYPAVMFTDTGFLRYPYYDTNEGGEDTPDQFDYESTGRVVQGLARTIEALAAGQNG
jgi:hypothetical protein